MASVELWKSFVDSFANLHDGVYRNWVVEHGKYPDVEDNKEINVLLTELSLDQRKVLAEMLVEARKGGVHDALVVLNDRMALQGGCYSEGGIEMDFQAFGSELYYDYVCRQAKEDWPVVV